MAVDERGEYVMSDEICRRCNGKQQRRRRGGRSVQLPDWFMILRSSSRHLCSYTYALRTYNTLVSYKISSPKKHVEVILQLVHTTRGSRQRINCIHPQPWFAVSYYVSLLFAIIIEIYSFSVSLCYKCCACRRVNDK